MADKSTAQRDVEYFTGLLAKETDENRRTILLRLLEDAENVLRAQGGTARTIERDDAGR